MQMQTTTRTATVTIYHNRHIVSLDERTRGNEHYHPTKTNTFPNEASFGEFAGQTRPRPCGPFFDFCGSCVLRKAYSYETDRTALDEIYDDSQNGIAEITGRQSVQERLGLRARSLSVGDVIVVGDQAFIVAGVGFEEATATAVQQALANEPEPGFKLL